MRGDGSRAGSRTHRGPAGKSPRRSVGGAHNCAVISYDSGSREPQVLFGTLAYGAYATCGSSRTHAAKPVHHENRLAAGRKVRRDDVRVPWGPPTVRDGRWWRRHRRFLSSAGRFLEANAQDSVDREHLHSAHRPSSATQNMPARQGRRPCETGIKTPHVFFHRLAALSFALYTVRPPTIVSMTWMWSMRLGSSRGELDRMTRSASLPDSSDPLMCSSKCW